MPDPIDAGSKGGPHWDERYRGGYTPCDTGRPSRELATVFDQGVIQPCVAIELPGFLATLRRVTKPGAKYQLLDGYANEQTEEGPPWVQEHEIQSELGELFDMDWIRALRFEDPGGVERPLGWSCLVTRCAGLSGCHRLRNKMHRSM